MSLVSGEGGKRRCPRVREEKKRRPWHEEEEFSSEHWPLKLGVMLVHSGGVVQQEKGKRKKAWLNVVGGGGEGASRLVKYLEPPVDNMQYSTESVKAIRRKKKRGDMYRLEERVSISWTYVGQKGPQLRARRILRAGSGEGGAAAMNFNRGKGKKERTPARSRKRGDGHSTLSAACSSGIPDSQPRQAGLLQPEERKES